MDFINFGYYIIEPVSKPNHIALPCEWVLSASGCICDHHPSLTGCFWQNHTDKQTKYKKLLRLSDTDFENMKKHVSHLFNEQRLDSDSRFANFSDAHDFYSQYLSHLSKARIVSIALEGVYQAAFLGEIKDTYNPLLPSKDQPPYGQWLGYDLLGWDYGGFHTYLCNRLDQDIAEKYPLIVNELGLIQNPYSEVRKFSEHIADKGEPVLWLPFAVYEYPIR
ncbi:MAG: hypothetical protein LBV33_03650 [Lachnospiraceae bacterium]|jgi:hypothetical protein|nr:hypothetical protein [Lachnospiraceae bacterium]